MKLLIVEDNERLLDRIQRQFEKTHIVETATTGKEALLKARDTEYGVIILDLGLPDMAGLEVCKQLRKQKVTSPILVLSGSNTITSRVALLENGADDYVTKPFNSEELRARIVALSRRQPYRNTKKALIFHDLVVDPETRTVSRAGIIVNLRRKEFDILEYLVSNSGRVLTREMIINNAWDSHGVSWTSTVDVHIKSLRDKIDRPFPVHYIHTAHGLGYKFDAPPELIKES